MTPSPRADWATPSYYLYVLLSPRRDHTRSILAGAGIGLAYGALPALIMSAVPVSETAAANSLNTLMRAIGTSVASAVAGAVLARMTITVGPVTVPSQNGFRLILAVAAGAAVIALAVAAFLPGRGRTGPAPAVPDRQESGSPESGDPVRV